MKSWRNHWSKNSRLGLIRLWMTINVPHGTPEETTNIVADLLNYGYGHQIARRGVVMKTLSQHPDLIEISSHLDNYYIMNEKDVNGQG